MRIQAFIQGRKKKKTEMSLAQAEDKGIFCLADEPVMMPRT